MPRGIGASMPVLVDSSLWVHQLRRGGEPARRAQVEALLQSGSACWCPPIRLELWRGASSESERKALRHFDALLPSYAITDAVWERAVDLADRGRIAGVTVPLADLLVFSCARAHDLQLAHDDDHFRQLARVEVGSGQRALVFRAEKADIGPAEAGHYDCRNPGTPEPRNLGTSEPRNPGTPEPRNPGTSEPRNPGTPRVCRTSGPNGAGAGARAAPV